MTLERTEVLTTGTVARQDAGGSLAVADVDDAAPPPSRATAPPVLVRAPLRSFLRNRNNVIALIVLIPLVGVAMLSPWLPLGNVNQTDLMVSLDPPSLDHLFGTDKLGRDILARTFAGLRISVIIGFCAAAISLTGGMLLGTVAGTLGKRVDAVISSVVDMMMAFPGVLLAITVVAVFGGGAPQLIFALGFASMPAAIRLQRSLTMNLRSATFMDAARMANAPVIWNLSRHILPNTFAPMVVVASIYAAEAILAEAALSFLGLGVVPPAPSLGNIIADGQDYLREGWWVSTIPGLTIVVLSLSLHFFSDGIREQLDPAIRTTVLAARKDRPWRRLTT